MTLAKEIERKFGKPLDGDYAVMDFILKRAAQACDEEGDECGDEGNKQTARRCSFRVRALASTEKP